MNNEELKVEFSDVGLSDLLRDPKGFLKYVCECLDEKRLVASMLAAVAAGWGLFGLCRLAFSSDGRWLFWMRAR